jgi:hypothetical protein
MRQWLAIAGFVVCAIALGLGHWLVSAGILLPSFWLWRREDPRRQPAHHKWAEGDGFDNSGFSASLPFLSLLDILDTD